MLVGWAFDIPVLKSIYPSFARMSANAALLFMCLGAGLWLNTPSQAHTARRIFGGMVVIVAALTLAEYAFDVNLGIDQLLFREPSSASVEHLGRMASMTAFNFLLLGLAVLLADVPRARRFRLGCAAVVAAAAFLAFCGYLFRVPGLYAIGASTSVPLHTTVGFLMASTAYFWGRPTEGLMPLLTSEADVGVLVRRLVPAIVFVSVALGWLTLLGHSTAQGFTTPTLVMPCW